ncbi:hypothetical protein D9M69_376080 [compost metagenome]
MSYHFTRNRDIVRFYEEYAYCNADSGWQEPLAAFISARQAQYMEHEESMATYLKAQLEASHNTS